MLCKSNLSSMNFWQRWLPRANSEGFSCRDEKVERGNQLGSWGSKQSVLCFVLFKKCLKFFLCSWLVLQQRRPHHGAFLPIICRRAAGSTPIHNDLAQLACQDFCLIAEYFVSCRSWLPFYTFSMLQCTRTSSRFSGDGQETIYHVLPPSYGIAFKKHNLIARIWGFVFACFSQSSGASMPSGVAPLHHIPWEERYCIIACTASCWLQFSILQHMQKVVAQRLCWLSLHP